MLGILLNHWYVTNNWFLPALSPENHISMQLNSHVINVKCKHMVIMLIENKSSFPTKMYLQLQVVLA